MDQLDDFLKQVRAIASRDNYISDEERDLITTVAHFIEEYRQFMLETTTGNGSRRKYLTNMKKNLLDTCWKISKRDRHISPEESDIITLIYNFLKDLQLYQLNL